MSNERKTCTQNKEWKKKNLKPFYPIYVGTVCLRITKFQSKLNFCLVCVSFGADIATINNSYGHCCARLECFFLTRSADPTCFSQK